VSGPDGHPLRRGAGERKPCDFQPSSCPKVSPTAGVALSPVNELVYIHYLECKAVGAFPDDPIVRRNAATISEAERSVIEERESQFQTNLLTAMRR
jgi:hypothetical protein